MQQPSALVSGVEVPPLMLADGAYPMLRFVVKRIHSKRTKKNATPEEKVFDLHHSSGRIVIEHTWSRLKGRWGILRKVDVDVATAADVIASCICLHNFVERLGEEYDGIDVLSDDEDNDDDDAVTDAAAKSLSESRRALLLEELVHGI